MALYPSNFNGQERLQPGGHGEMFVSDIPGHRGEGKRVNRSNSQLSTCAHDVPNIKYQLDDRLPVLFRYGWGHGFNALVVPKGRLMSVDAYMNLFNSDMEKSYNVYTLANGGSFVKLNESTGIWEKVKTEVDTTDADNPIIKIKGTTDKLGIDTQTGLVTINSVPTRLYRAANKPLGMAQRNEYNRFDEALNGMEPSPILTDALVTLPLFLDKDKAEKNPWGSAYGKFLPGDLVKSDENGRFIPSPLNSAVEMAKAGLTDAVSIELERQQVVGQVHAISRDLVPEGAARFVQWSLSDRKKFDQFNPETWRGNNRDGEDIINHSPHELKNGGPVNGSISTTGKNPYEHPGYPFEQTMSQHDLHMLASTSRHYDLRFSEKDILDRGIPGLTDGYNAYVKEYGPEKLHALKAANTVEEYVETHMKTSQVGIEPNSIEIAVTTKLKKDLTTTDFKQVIEGQTLKPVIDSTASTEELIKVKYLDEKQGYIVLDYTDVSKFHDFMTEASNATFLSSHPLNVFVRYKKRGLAGVPTFLDWDGVQGTICILLQK